jgi:putative Mg2+ transporter-C (MgtC) family protein
MIESLQTTVPDILVRLLAAGLIGGLIGFERRAHHKAIGIAGMVLIAIGSTTFAGWGSGRRGISVNLSWS